MPRGLDRLDHDQLAAWLRETDPARLDRLWARADAVRAAHVGDAVHLRGLIEISNHCVRALPLLRHPRALGRASSATA